MQHSRVKRLAVHSFRESARPDDSKLSARHATNAGNLAPQVHTNLLLDAAGLHVSGSRLQTVGTKIDATHPGHRDGHSLAIERTLRLRVSLKDSAGLRYADGMLAMPSARALLVASLLTEPPYGCLGPRGNDRYRKRLSLGALQINCQSRGGSFAMSRPPAVVRAGAIGS